MHPRINNPYVQRRYPRYPRLVHDSRVTARVSSRLATAVARERRA